MQDTTRAWSWKRIALVAVPFLLLMSLFQVVVSQTANAATYTHKSAVHKIHWNTTWGVWGNTRVYYRQYNGHKEYYAVRGTVDDRYGQQVCGWGPLALSVWGVRFRTTIYTGLYNQTKHVFTDYVTCHDNKLTTHVINFDASVGQSFGPGPVVVEQTEDRLGVNAYSGPYLMYIK